MEVTRLRDVVTQNAQRVAELGKWPSYIQPGSLLERIPGEGDKNAPGFDAGIACATDLIPRDKQELAARLHANYTKEAVMQIRKEAAEKNPDSQTMWWLAACSTCSEGGIDQQKFLEQIEAMKQLTADPKSRGESAVKEFETMTHSFVLKEGVPYGEKDGSTQGAYIAGYPYGTTYSEKYGIFFIGTYEESLGLEDFQWSDEKDEKGRAKSGPVFGSKQFVKCATEDEWRRAMEVVKKKLPMDVETKTGRPTETDFAQKVEGYLFPLKNGMEGQYESTKMELEDMAAGGGNPSVREQYYSGWTDADFKEILRRLNEEEKKIK